MSWAVIPVIMNEQELEGKQMFFLLLEIFIPFQVLAHVGPALSYVLSRFEASADFEPETFGPAAAASSRATADSIHFAFFNRCSYPRLN